ncbi:hypothetical protein [Saccharibacillus qingshengii]|uniref:hypothetical protein n=1 Tax=Saccharibacillus qingshengii TaxID=1763540 RepID=UPI0015537E48|nr:hypothetical protein [Saccharibacillus qingshengii]
MNQAKRSFYRKFAVLFLCVLFMLLPEIRLPGAAFESPGAELRHLSYHQQHHYVAPSSPYLIPVPDTAGLPLFPGLLAACLIIVLRNPYMDSPIPILYKHRMLRPLKFRCSFVSFFRVRILFEL